MNTLKLLFFTFCILGASLVFYAPPATAEKSGDTKVTVRVPDSSHRLKLLNRNFIFVGNAKLPESFTSMRNKWQKIVLAHEQSVFEVENIPLPKQHKEQWARLSNSLGTMNAMEKLRNINGFFNSIPSRKDMHTYQETEHWATPREFLQKRAGDCEDYAIAKYFALQYFSWSMHDVWIVFLRDNVNNGLHVVAAARHEGNVFILDNLSKPAQLLIPEFQYAKQIKPIAILNHLGMWLPISEKSKKQ